MDPYAELDGQDEDLLLHDIAGASLLIAAVELGNCPKREYCCLILEDIARDLTHRPTGDRDVVALRDAATWAARRCREPLVLRWAAYVGRLLLYREPRGQVNRAAAETMAADLFARPTAQQRWAGMQWLAVRAAANGRLWECSGRYTESHLYINRRTGVWRMLASDRATAEDLAAI
jgi:hypothetical protein